MPPNEDDVRRTAPLREGEASSINHAVSTGRVVDLPALVKARLMREDPDNYFATVRGERAAEVGAPGTRRAVSTHEAAERLSAELKRAEEARNAAERAAAGYKDACAALRLAAARWEGQAAYWEQVAFAGGGQVLAGQEAGIEHWVSDPASIAALAVQLRKMALEVNVLLDRTPTPEATA